MARTTFTGPVIAGKEQTTTSQGTDGEFRLLNSTNGKLVSLKASTATAADVSFTLPALDGTAGQAIVTNGSGVLSFGNVGVPAVTSNPPPASLCRPRSLYRAHPALGQARPARVRLLLLRSSGLAHPMQRTPWPVVAPTARAGCCLARSRSRRCCASLGCTLTS